MTTSVFTLSCVDWYDDDGNKDYVVYAWTNNPMKKSIVAYSAMSTFQMQLPAGDTLSSALHLTVNIRDQLDCIVEMNISSITVTINVVAMIELINDIQSASGSITSNTVIQLLASGNQNIVGQVITSVSQQFNRLSTQSIDTAVSNGVSVTSIFISSLSTSRGAQSTAPLNQSASDEYQKERDGR